MEGLIPAIRLFGAAILVSLAAALALGIMPLILAAPAGVAAPRMATLAGMVAMALAGAALAGFVAFMLMRRWMSAVRQAIDDLRTGRSEARPTATLGAMGEEVQKALDEFDTLRRRMDAADVEWTPETLTLALANELPGAEIIVVSNREPYIHNRSKTGGISLQIPASGLVSALEPVVRACGGTWVAHGSGTADRETVDANDRVAVPPDNPSYTLRRVWLSEEEQDGYYYGFANEGLWPLCHIAFVRPIFRETRLADVPGGEREIRRRRGGQEAREPDPIILIQDYHFALLPRMMRERLPQATIVTFWHIPWPNAETFGICP